MNSLSFILIIILLISILIALFFLIITLRSKLEDMKIKQLESQSQALKQQQELFLETQNSMMSQLKIILNTVTENLTKTQGNITDQLKVVGEIGKKLGELHETAKQIQEIGKDISSLEELFKSPKIRGEMGEITLENLLSNVLAKDMFEAQYRFQGDNEPVDFIIKIDNKKVPIDSKFPIDKFRDYIKDPNNQRTESAFIKAIKDNIDSIAQKYIRPQEGTYNFALMYIPAENIYYETIINKDIYKYAMKKNVFPVSPNTLYIYLQAIIYGLKGLQIEKEAENFLKKLDGIKQKFEVVERSFSTLGTHINNAASKYTETKNHIQEITFMLNNLTLTKETEQKQ
jgi:DNA recombination protein RmuC